MRRQSLIVDVVTDDDASIEGVHKCADVLRRLHVHVRIAFQSALHAPDDWLAYAENIRDEERLALVAGSRRGYLPCMTQSIAHATTVIAVPVGEDYFSAMTALLTTVQMPRGAPVLTVAVNGWESAAVAAAKIIAPHKKTTKQALERYFAEQHKRSIRSKLPE